jgi:hypothetical protein
MIDGDISTPLSATAAVRSDTEATTSVLTKSSRMASQRDAIQYAKKKRPLSLTDRPVVCPDETL